MKDTCSFAIQISINLVFCTFLCVFLFQYITYSGNGFLNSLNMTKSDVEVVFKALNDGGQSMGKAAVILMNDNSAIAPLMADFRDAADGGTSSSMLLLQFYTTVNHSIVFAHISFF